MAGIGTSNPIFNVSCGLYYDSHEIELKHKKQVYYDYGYNSYWAWGEEKEKKDDTLIGSYIKFDWSILPIKRKNFKAGTNLALLIAAAYSDLGDFEIPVSATASLQVRFKNIDVLAGFQYVIYALCSEMIEDYGGGGGNGGSINTPLFNTNFSITGMFTDENDTFDKSRHAVKLNVNAGSAIREAASKTTTQKNEGKSTDAVDDLIIKVGTAPKKKFRVIEKERSCESR